MRKLVMLCLCSGYLIGCSSSNAPKPRPQTIVIDNCSDARDLVKGNHYRIDEAFMNNDAAAIGTLELQNRAIVNAAPECFPKLEEKIKYWKKMHKDADM